MDLISREESWEKAEGPLTAGCLYSLYFTHTKQIFRLNQQSYGNKNIEECKTCICANSNWL